ncbi:DNA translocase FtsK [Litoreibacter roseus]|uniref:DNA translocase FtsK n=1 Tax=Litoreibacter roseus TaxID=2601869 RepID=A0A6N6JJG4_9RHOB|nr:DNA translocase FtsK [Litoreibacter roseus]GFE66274.1 hypothetical protein KIN_33480 [Litoreibacter roseus]
MAFQARPRDPFLDSDMQAAIEKRGKELVGLAMLAIGILTAMLLISYVPEDPSWLSATDEPAKNWLGRFGASLASPLFIIVGFGAWAIPVILCVWGVRFTFHMGADRAFGRMIFAPLAVALASVYATTHLPPEGWAHSFGPGGLFGETVLGAILTIAPISATLGLKIVALLVFATLIAFSLFVLGFERHELLRIGRFMLVGTILTYASLMRVLRSLIWGGVSAARARAARSHTDDYVDDEPIEGPSLSAPVPTAPKKPSLLARIPALVKRPDPEELNAYEGQVDHDTMSPEDRIKSKISDVVRNRGNRLVAERDAPIAPRAEPILTRDRAEPPLQADVDEDDPMDMPEYLSAPTNRLQSAPITKPVVQHPARKAPTPSKKAQAEAQPALQFDETNGDGFELPPLNLLANPTTIERYVLSDEALEENARMLEAVLDDYGVKGEIVSVRPGPVVTMYELEPAPGLKASRVIGLADDIARSMSALSARVSTVPGRSVIGIELPNEKREMVVLREILAARDFGDGNQKLPLALGKDIGGEAIVANLAKMPHLLIAGTTGSGKSVAINTMILSLLYKLTPEECRLIMIDPKMLELSVYDGIPHLLSPVVTDPKKAVVALKWVVGEMEERYRKMSKMGVRNIDGYNGRVKDALSRGELFSRTVQTGFDDETGEPVFETEEFQPEAMPYIVVIVDEMADLMMVAGKEIEACIQRLAQMARASGIHLIMATQRPSVDVITGTIKANFPTRISFQVTSKIDSRTILGEQGAEQLLGMGDMLYMAGGSKITRIHGPFVSDEEVEEIVTHLKSFGPPSYMSGVVEGPDEEKSSDIDMVLGLGGNTDGEDALYDTAVQVVLKDRKCSTSYIQRKLAIGYNKAARLVEQMEEQGLVSPANHVGKREILVPEQ